MAEKLWLTLFSKDLTQVHFGKVGETKEGLEGTERRNKLAEYHFFFKFWVWMKKIGYFANLKGFEISYIGT